MICPETPAVVTASIFNILSRTLTLAGYSNLDLDAKRLTLDEAARLLKNKEVSLTNKRQIIHYLDVLKVQVWLSEAEETAISEILDNWNVPPF